MRKVLLFIYVVLFTNFLSLGQLNLHKSNSKDYINSNRGDITTLPHIESFEGDAWFADWTMYNATDYDPVSQTFANYISHHQSETDSYDGTCCICFSSYKESELYDLWLVSPRLNLGNNTQNIKVSFYYKRYIYGTEELFRVGYNTEPTINSDLDNFLWGNQVNVKSTEYQYFEIILPPETQHFTIHYMSEYQYYLFVDYVTIEYTDEPLICEAPENLTATINGNSVLLEWENREIKNYYNVYRNDTLIAENINVTNYTDNDISQGSYKYYIKRKCLNGFETEPSNTVEIILGIENKDNNISVYPNPVKDKLFISGNDINNITLYNIMGQRIYHLDRVTNFDNIINTTSLQNGIYILNINTNDGRSLSKRLIISK